MGAIEHAARAATPAAANPATPAAPATLAKHTTTRAALGRDRLPLLL